MNQDLESNEELIICELIKWNNLVMEIKKGGKKVSVKIVSDPLH